MSAALAVCGCAAVLLAALLSCAVRPDWARRVVGVGEASAAREEASENATRPPLPRFEAPRLDEGAAGTDLLLGRRGLVYVFASTDPDAARIAGLVSRLQKDAQESNAVVLGVSRDADRLEGLRFVRRHGLEFAVVADVNQSITRKLRIPPGKSVVLAVDAEGRIAGGFAGLEAEVPDYEKVLERQLRELLHLPELDGVHPSLGVLPDAPQVPLVSLDGKRESLSSMRGKVVVLILFSPLCPHCHAALRFLSGLSTDLAHPDLRVVPVSVLDRRYVLEDLVAKEQLPFPVYVDANFEVQRAYEHAYIVPDIVVVTREGRIFARHQGYSERIEALLAMEVRQALAVKNVLLLDREGFSGEENCRICHLEQHETWALTSHAYAFETLVQHGADRNPECLPCHTVGWNQTGGYSLATPIDYLQGVQCENCHGRGGPHQSPDFVKEDYQPVCLPCHNPKHSLHFEFASRIPLVSHAANKEFTRLSIDERRRLLEQRDRRARTLFNEARFVGSESCQRCHEAEYDLWSRSGHARAFDTLRREHKDSNPDCQKCHTTGFEKEGGFPDGGDAVLNVGCESCHGPGGDHVVLEQPPPGTILKLADKCDSCVLLQICGSCHDDANDPGFEFELMDKLDRIRHGMTVVGSADR